jgi:HAE1 family hydrophobic/amphiphilic exporter-1
MSRFSIRNPYFIIVRCLLVLVLGVTSLVRMPVDLFPAIRIPVVMVATFFNGMPPEQIETDITGRFERFFTLGSGIEHMESRSLPGVSLIKISSPGPIPTRPSPPFPTWPWPICGSCRPGRCRPWW